jgi:hypothetical protein
MGGLDKERTMPERKIFSAMDPDDIKDIIHFIENPDSPVPAVVRDLPMRDLGRVIELPSEFLVVMPPNLALRMPKKPGASPDTIRDQIISMVAMHVKVVNPE